MDEAGGVDEHVHRADLGGERLDGGRGAHVELSRVGLEARERGLDKVGRDHARAFVRENLGDGAADAGAGGGDERSLALETIHGPQPRPR